MCTVRPRVATKYLHILRFCLLLLGNERTKEDLLRLNVSLYFEGWLSTKLHTTWSPVFSLDCVRIYTNQDGSG